MSATPPPGPASGGSDGHLDDLRRYLDASPSPYHAVAEAAARLAAAGFTPVRERDDWPGGPGGHYLVRGGTLVAWATGTGPVAERGFRIVGAHTDSPNLRVKPNPDTGGSGWRQLAVEVYGGALRNSWLDRDLGLSGRVSLRGAGGPEVRLLHLDEPLLRVPQLAIHLDRGVNDGLRLDPQRHLVPVWGTGASRDGDLARFLAGRLGCRPDDVLAWDLMTHDLTPAAVLGEDRSLLASGRIDNLASCHAAVQALVRAAGTAPEGPVPVVCLFDHEEIGSESSSGASSSILPTLLERVAGAAGADGREAWFRALAASWCLSADGAHATHPNYADRHEPGHHVLVNGGPVVKSNANVRYATDAVGAGRVAALAEHAGVPLQRFVVRSDLPCGSTIGPVTASRLGITTVDVGIPQLSMHSARELCGTEDPSTLARLLAAFLADTDPVA